MKVKVYPPGLPAMFTGYVYLLSLISSCMRGTYHLKSTHVKPLTSVTTATREFAFDFHSRSLPAFKFWQSRNKLVQVAGAVEALFLHI